MAQGTIKTTIRRGKFTQSHSGESAVHINQYGNIIIFEGFCTNIQCTANQLVLIGTISGVTNPAVQIRTTCAMSDQAYNSPSSICYFYITTGGVVTMLARESGKKAIYFDVCWFAY